MDTKRICSICGKPLTPSAPEGLCPECLLKAGLDTGVDIGADTEGKTSRFTPPKTEELAAKFSQLEILEFIGQGGMGAVYKARQKQLDRVVALKILPPQAGGAAFAERFTREARALARLNHPHIVTLYEFGQSDGLFYFLMEFVDGVNLRQLLSNSRVSPREALAIVPQICDALQFAHDSGIVHRDIKPENIMLDKKGQVKIADFGVAKMIAESLVEAAGRSASVPGELTEAGSTLGTPQYMAPEQIKNSAEVDHRADIYSLGVVFYQMLTGELPSGKIEPPSRKLQIDVRLDEVVLRALERKPELRFQQASEVKTAVETIATTLESPPAETPPGFTHYKDPKSNFELDIPEGWNTLPPDYKNSVYELIRFISYKNGTHLLILFRKPHNPAIPLKDISDAAQRVLSNAKFGNFISAETAIGGKPARTLDFDRPMGNGTWSCREYFVTEGPIIYTVGLGTTDKSAMFETFDRTAKSFRFRPSDDGNALKPFFPKAKSVAAEPKPEPGSQETKAAIMNTSLSFVIPRTIFIVAFAINIIAWIIPNIRLSGTILNAWLNTGGTYRLVNYPDLIQLCFRLGFADWGWGIFDSLMFIWPFVFIALAILYPRRWVFVSGSIFAFYEFLFGLFFPHTGEIQVALICIVFLYIAKAMALAGFWVRPMLKPESTGQNTETETKLPPEGYAVRIEPVKPQAARRFGIAEAVGSLAIILVALVILLSVNTVQPKPLSVLSEPQDVLSEANFLQKFDSNQIAEATITEPTIPDSGATITGKFIKVDVNGKNIEEGFIVPTAVLTPSMEDKLMASKNIRFSKPNPIVRGTVGQILFCFVVPIGLTLLFVVAILIFAIYSLVRHFSVGRSG
jgi:serine/threonine protein kinase